MESQLSVSEIAAAVGVENLVLRMVQLQRRVLELEAQVAASAAAETPVG